MKQFGQLTKHEQLELQDLSNRNYTIRSLIDRLMQEESAYNQKREEWFMKIRKKYNIPEEDSIYIDPEDDYRITREPSSEE